MTHLVAGFLLGLAGSVHCLAMCGPLVLYSSANRGADRPVRLKPDTTRADRSATRVVSGFGRTPGLWMRFLAHHASRLVVYVALGAAAGFAGSAVAEAGWRNGLALVAGILLVVQAVGLGGRLVTAMPSRRLAAAISAAARLVPQRGIGRSIALGMLNGLMPCGLLYAALAAAAGLGQPADAVGFMLMFAIGSLPTFAALAYSARAIVPRLPQRFRQAAPIAVALVGVMLIARGLPARSGHAASPHMATHASH